ncbi:MAG: NFACT RNA binding domain-containing protein [Synechococcales bacterium]|nr:NFACT RNA binding domain-containing protein [Synechococcales bacterium]
MQTVDFTTLTAICADLRQHWLPARVEQVYQRDRHTITLALRTLEGRGWLDISWHVQAARLCIGTPPPRTPDTFTFSQQLRHQIGGLALVEIGAIAPWERALDLRFARRPGDPPLWHLYVEIMGKYSNVILTNQQQQVVTAAHQVGSQQSSVRAIQTGQPYEPPPSLTNPVPSLEEPFDRWQERVGLVPDRLWRSLLNNYRGLSPLLTRLMATAAGLDPNQSTADLDPKDWQRLHDRWREWLHILHSERFTPGWLPEGYTVLPWGAVAPAKSVQHLVNQYYTDQLSQQTFSQLRHQLSQKLASILKKLYIKAEDFQQRLQQSDQADRHREQADLLMAYLHEWQPGMTTISLPDFATEEPVAISLDPTKNAVQNAQALYKRHQKMKRSRLAITPLLEAVQAEIDYLEQVEAAIAQFDDYQTPDDLTSLMEIRDELIQQGYLEDTEQRRSEAQAETDFHRYPSPGGYDILVGRNNRQNDRLTFRVATDYDLWFHTQEIPGSHVLLRLNPGAVPDDADLQVTADIAAHYSRARQGDQVPVVYTEPRHVYKPKGAMPGMAIYKQEQVIWGNPQRGKAYVTELGRSPTATLTGAG